MQNTKPPILVAVAKTSSAPEVAPVRPTFCGIEIAIDPVKFREFIIEQMQKKHKKLDG